MNLLMNLAACCVLYYSCTDLSIPKARSMPYGTETGTVLPLIEEAPEAVDYLHALTFPSDRPDLLRAIVFPEVLRYSFFRDLIETTALEEIYVICGSQGADFSVGPFQMKPSFVELLEEELRRHDELAQSFQDVMNYPYTEVARVRSERVKRLSTITWQLRYLECFYALMHQRTLGWEWHDEREELRFYAAAYNSGFTSSDYRIKRSADRRTFPWGTSYTGSQGSYADYSEFYFVNHLNQ